MPAILNAHGEPYRLVERRERRAERLRQLRARYDAAQTGVENVRHWAAADALSADAANSAAVRETLRKRARYEYLNSAYVRGIVETLAVDLIGTGPKLQVSTGDPELNQKIEARWRVWARAIGLARKLRLMRRAKCVDGEAFSLLTSKRRAATPIELNVRPIEAERVTDQFGTQLAADRADGIRFDAEGEPIEYNVLRYHPGGNLGLFSAKGDTIPAGEMVHLFRDDRPEQHRGVPEITPALPLFALLRRLTLAELVGREQLAEITGVLETPQPELDGYDQLAAGTTDAEPSAYTIFDVFDLERGSILVLPELTKFHGVDSKGSAGEYSQVKREILAEAFSCVVMPFNVGAHDSSGFNFASGKLDRLTYNRIIRVEQSQWEIDCLFILLISWWREAQLVWRDDFGGLPGPVEWSITWHWDGAEDIDETKAASAQKMRLGNATTTYPIEYSRAGLDAETELKRQAELLGQEWEDYRIRLADKLLSTGQQA